MGYPTPNLPDFPQDFKCVKVYVPTSVEDVFFSVLMGQIAEMTKEYYWVPFGDMTPEQCANLWKEAIALIDADGVPCEMLDCSEVQDCVQSETGTTEIVNAESGLVTSIQNKQLGKGMPVIDGCNEDAVFGAVTELVEYLIQACTDTFERIEQATNILELVITWLGYSDLASVIQGALDYIAWAQEAIADEFSAEVTQALIDEYRCDLYCLHMDGCGGLTPNDVTAYFAGRISGQGVMDVLEDLWEFITTGSWAGTQVVDAMIFSVLGVMTVSDHPIRALVIPNLYTINTVFALGANTPDPDWSILCTACIEETWCKEWDLQLSAYDFAPDGANARGVWVDGLGFIQTYNTNCGIYLGLPFSVANVTAVEIEYDLQSASGTRQVDVWLLNGASVVAHCIDINTAGNGVIASWSGDVSADSIQIKVDARSGTCTTGYSSRLYRVKIEGAGTNPFGSSDC